MTNIGIVSLDELAAQVPDGSTIAMVKDESGAPVALAKALIRKGTRDLHLITVPTGGYAVDLLIGAGCVGTIETSGVSLGEIGGAPRFAEAVKSGDVAILDATCPAVYAALQAGEKGIPFIPIRGILGADIAATRADWKLINNPFAEDGEQDPVLLLPAIRPDIALIHAPMADRNGNIWIGREHELAIMAHAAHRTLVTVEEVVDDDFLAREATTAGTLAAFYVNGMALAEKGAWPTGLGEVYERDNDHIAAYARDAKSREGFSEYVGREVMDADHAANGDRDVA